MTQGFSMTAEGQEDGKHLLIKLGLLMSELDKEGVFGPGDSGGYLTFKARFTDQRTGKEYDVIITYDDNDEGTNVGFASKDIVNEEDLLARQRSTIDYFVSLISDEGLNRVNEQYVFLTMENELEGSA